MRGRERRKNIIAKAMTKGRRSRVRMKKVKKRNRRRRIRRMEERIK
jgi:hypothetical protein